MVVRKVPKLGLATNYSVQSMEQTNLYSQSSQDDAENEQELVFKYLCSLLLKTLEGAMTGLISGELDQLFSFQFLNTYLDLLHHLAPERFNVVTHSR